MHAARKESSCKAPSCKQEKLSEQGSGVLRPSTPLQMKPIRLFDISLAVYSGRAQNVLATHCKVVSLAFDGSASTVNYELASASVSFRDVARYGLCLLRLQYPPYSASVRHLPQNRFLGHGVC